MRSNQISSNVGTNVQPEVRPMENKHNSESPEGLNRLKKVLIVDDEPRNVKLLAAKLPQRDYEIIRAYNGSSALKIVQKESPDLILLDVMMPDLNGYEVTQKLKNEPSTQNIPIILVTALEGPEEKTKGLKAGADDFLNKPVHYAELITRVRSLLRLKEYQEKSKPTINSRKSAIDAPEKTEEKVQGKVVPSILSIGSSMEDERWIQECRDDQKYKISRVQDGKEAISLIGQEEVDVLLINVPLPGMDASELCKLLKKLEKTKNIQIMLVTNQEDLASTVKVMEYGADDFMVKPVVRNIFTTRIEILLQKKQNADRVNAGAPTLVGGTINDTMSGLYTWDYFNQQLNLEIKRSMRQRYPLTLMIIHIDILEMDDDKFGDLTREQVIHQYGQVIKQCIRDEDFAAFYSDHEFATLLPFLDKQNAGSIVKRIEKAICEHVIFPHGSSDKLSANASLGFACCPADACSADRLAQRAAVALRRIQKSKQG